MTKEDNIDRVDNLESKMIDVSELFIEEVETNEEEVAVLKNFYYSETMFDMNIEHLILLQQALQVLEKSVPQEHYDKVAEYIGYEMSDYAIDFETEGDDPDPYHKRPLLEELTGALKIRLFDPTYGEE